MIKYFYTILFSSLLLISCGKADNYIPDVPVNFTTLLTDPRLAGLSSGTPIFINGYGIAGLILYKSGAKYMAYDRCSTVNPQNKCALVLDETKSITVTDPCTGAKFLLLDGSPAKAPAIRDLKEYNVYISNNTISVTN
ncbi:hypothetical protein EZJ43_15240 [Pedobacter changchengzhani]|uniref:Rieske domain-containing protein n=1 Tax=Pedobacter changchengzhani TaxID=2529274 RepID=A0A4R5MJ39_9SPHI|nr:hypothetical protein [Pedobacter changchengzhani]TDG35079.1 hypothetical protein EZJ43_15240 [Pedobacter changchengzhani]